MNLFEQGISPTWKRIDKKNSSLLRYYAILTNRYDVIFQTISSYSFFIPFWPLQASDCISQTQNTFLSFASLFAYPKFFPSFLVSFPICCSHSTLCLPLLRVLQLYISHTFLGFLLLSILIRCPDHLNSLLSTVLVTGSSFTIPLIWVFIILSLLVIPVHFLKYQNIPFSRNATRQGGLTS